MSRLLTMNAAAAIVLSVAAAMGAASPAAAGPGLASDDTTSTVVYVAPSGAGTDCSQAQPCSIAQAQQRVRALIPDMNGDIEVQLAGGTYRLAAPLQFGAADSGAGGHTVIWDAAPGAHPVLSGAVPVTGWKLADAAHNMWQAPVPADLDTRQIYVDGQEAPVAQTTPAEEGVSLAAAPGGYTVSPASWANKLQQLDPSDLSRVEFVWTGGNGPWTESRCPIASVSGATITMAQPCWNNVIHRPTFRDASGGLPSMPAATAPTRIENAAAFLHPGQWYLDAAKHVLDYMPAAGKDVTQLDVEAPRLESLVTGEGTLAAPVHDITFSGLTFTGATWTKPSSKVGFAEVQDNLTLTSADTTTPQATCTFGTPPGTCPFGALTREPGNVSWSAAHDVTFSGNTFVNLGAAGLVLENGSKDNTIEGNEFTGIAGNAVILGNTTDPHPSDVGADDREIISGNTIGNNLIHDIGTDYPGAAAITLFFSQHTLVTHNDLYDLPYTGITAGVVQGHVDNADHPDNTTNVNSDNTISNNLIHQFMQKMYDGGAIYIEGHQGQTIKAADGSVDRAASIAHGLTVDGNVAYDQGHVNFTWYDDAGSQWIGFHHNVEWDGQGKGQGGCQSTGHLDYTGNHNSDATGVWACSPPAPVDTNVSDNTTIPARPAAADLPESVLSQAGLTGDFRSLETTQAPTISYTQASGGSGPQDVLVAGSGFTPDTQVSFAGNPATAVKVLSANFLVATAPATANPTQVQVTTASGTSATEPALVPTPSAWTGGAGRMRLSSSSRIVIDAGQAGAVTTGPTSQVLGSQTVADVADDLQKDLASANGLSLPVVPVSKGTPTQAGDIRIELGGEDPSLGVEGYNLSVSDSAVISAATTTGAYWGTRTILQELAGGPSHTSLPRSQVHDVPAVPMRSYALDMARKYWKPSYVYDLIRQMSYLKMNVLFMHLADAEGFRLNSPKFPGLADPATSYDRDQIEKFVDFARAHNVILVPGFEMPGHATSVTDYFHIGLGDGADPCPASSVYSWVTPQYVMDMTNPAALDSMRKMLDEFVPWFPGPWVHIGADELPSSVASCPRIASYLSAHPELGGLDGLVNNFLNNVDDTLRAAGKQTAVYSGFNPKAAVKLHQDVLVTDWTDAASTLAGYPVLNETTKAYLTPNNYHHLYPDPGYLLSQWTPGNDGGVTTQGGAMSVWADYNFWAEDSYFENLAALPRAAVADRTWSAAPAADTVAAFKQRLSAVGDAPGYVGFSTKRSTGNGPIHEWDFEPAGRPAGYVDAAAPGYVKFFKDSAGSLNGSSYILASPSSVRGVRGKAIHVDTAGQGVALGGSDVAGPWTVSAWVRRTGSSAPGSPSTLLYSQAGNEIRLEQSGTPSDVGITTGGKDYHFDYATPLNGWTLLTLVSDHGTTSLYANGKRVGQLDVSMPLPLAALGGRNQFVHADLDQITVYDKARSAQQIESDYAAIAPPQVEVTPATADVKPGDQIQYTITVTNPCGCSLTGAKLDLTAGDGLQVSPSSFDLGTIPAGGTVTKQATATAPDHNATATVTAALTYTSNGVEAEADGSSKVTAQSAHSVFSQAYDGPSYKRLTRTISVPAGGGSMKFWTDYATEQGWDYMFVEAHTPGQDDWTTLPDANGHTSTTPGDSCVNDWVSLHPQMAHYQTYSNGKCTSTGTTGSWNAATGSSGGWVPWEVDLSKWAGKDVEVSISYASDWATNDAGVWIDDIALPDGTTSTFEDGDLDGWTVSGAPTGDPTNPNDYIVTETASHPAP